MGRALVVVRSDGDRAKAARWASKAPDGCRIEFKASRRTLPQNARMWSMLQEISEQVLWHGQRLRPDDYKLIFLDALKRELRVVPNLDGNGFVNLGRSSSDLSKAEMGDLLDLVSAWGTEHGVVFSGEKGEA